MDVWLVAYRLGLAIVADVADQHGWAVEATDGDGGRARIEGVTGARKNETAD